MGFIEGHTVAELTEIANEVYEESIAERVWPGTRALAQMHLDVGQQVWLVTAAPVEVAGIIAARLGLTGALGTTAEHNDGVYTGRLKGHLLHGPAKARPYVHWHMSTDLILPTASRTRTPTTTSPCCRWSATRARSILTAGCGRMPKSRTGRFRTTEAVERRHGWGCSALGRRVRRPAQWQRGLPSGAA